MTRFVWDQFSKDFLETLLSPYGNVVAGQEVTSEIKEIDVWFSPNTSEIPSQLGLLGQLCQSSCLFEPYRNPITFDSICDCLFKRFAVRDIFKREAKRKKRRILENEMPKLWILTPTASQRVLSPFAAHLTSDWGNGVYFLAAGLGAAFVVIHQLPETPDTLWLRLLGRGGTRARAIDEIEALSPDNPLKSDTLALLYNVSRNLETQSRTTIEDREFIMRLAPLYQQDKEQAIQQGEQQGEAKLVIRQLQRRFGEIPQTIEETIKGLSTEKLENLGIALLDFEGMDDLVRWLEHPTN